MNEAVKKFILLVEVHFPRQKFSGDEGKEALWLRSMSEILSDYDEATLGEAANTIIRTRDPDGKSGTMFPKPSECIRVCDTIRLRKEFEAMPIFSAENVVRIAAPRNLPSITTKVGDPAWPQWLAHFEGSGKKDMAQAAERLGYVRASSIYPRSETVVFEPAESGQYAFAQLRSMSEGQ